MTNRKVWIFGISCLIIAVCVSILFVEKISYEQKTTYIKIESFGKTAKGIDYITGQDPYVFNSEPININISEKQKKKLEVGGVYMLKYSKITEGKEDKEASYILDKIGDKRE